MPQPAWPWQGRARPSASGRIALWQRCHGGRAQITPTCAHHGRHSEIPSAALLTDQAVWVPTVSQRDVDFVSKRLHNYEYNPVWGFLADQSWLG
jgi:hypothetical protein